MTSPSTPPAPPRDRLKVLGPTMRHFTPRRRVRSLSWFQENIQTHEGKPYDHGAYPHLGAPGGPCDALDDPYIRVVWLQFGSRLGKTFLGNSFLLWKAETEPAPMMFAAPDQRLATDVAARIYGMIERCGPLAGQLRPENLRRQDRIDLDAVRIFTAWARSVSTLADKAVRWGHAGEIDKFHHVGAESEKAREADPLKLFDDRFKEFPSHKKIKESTPTVKGKSRVEAGLLQSTNCRFWVPCPHCEEYQVLKKEQIRWEKLEDGKSDRDLARRTAHYVCVHCEKKIVDHHRGPMMRAGVWAPEGCGVDSKRAKAATKRWYAPEAKGGDGARLEPPWKGWQKADWITGPPTRDGLEAGYQLSSLYALSLSWGDIAAEWVSVQGRAQDLRNFINQWLGECWEFAERKQTWTELGERIIRDDVPRLVVPRPCSLVTLGVDKQKDHYKYVLDSWGPGRYRHTMNYGQAESLAWILKHVIGEEYAVQETSHALRLAVTLIDSGFRPREVLEFCREQQRRRLWVYPCKGSNKPLGVPYRTAILGKESAMPGMRLVHVDTLATQDWIDRVLHDVSHEEGDEGAATLFAGTLAAHRDFLEELLNDTAVTDIDAHNYERESWNRISTAIPNDFRDASRYSYAAMLIATRGGPIAEFVPPAGPQRPVTEEKERSVREFSRRRFGGIRRQG